MPMQMKDRTKLMFREHLEEMLKNISFEKVRIVDLCKSCNAAPQTFYYHFTDKYELVAWIYLYDFSDVFCETRTSYSLKTLNQILKKIEKKRSFYKEVFKDNSYNSIVNYIHRFNVKMGIIALKHINPDTEITFNQMLAIKYHSYGTIGITREWLYGDIKISAREFAEFQLKTIPVFLREAYDKYPYSRMEVLQQVGKQKE